MRYEHVCIEAVAHTLPPNVITSDALEQQLRPVYERLGLPAGRLELMTGIRERRWFDPGMLPGTVSIATAREALAMSGLNTALIGALIHGSVCRDQMEPATAAGVHSGVGLPDSCLVMDVSNACLGLLNGMLIIADQIELGRIRAGIVVGTESGRDLVEGTIHSLLNDPGLTRQSIKPAFASLTIGSGSAAIVLCDRSLSRTRHRLLGGSFLSDSSAHKLCAGGIEGSHGDGRPRMETDSEALLHAGIALARKTWTQASQVLGWQNRDVSRVFTHQVGRQHRTALMQQLNLDPSLDFPTVEFLGNTGAAALPMAMSLGLKSAPAKSGERFALLGIGSGLNSIMLGTQMD
ncbi:MAG: 3-oxoacyl-ACP synthase III [Planctomycetia bacterium]